MTDERDEFELPDLGDMIAAMDQIKAQAPNVADVLWTHYLHLVQEGFTTQQALWAAVAYMLQTPGPPPE